MAEQHEALLSVAAEAARLAGSAIVGLRRKPRVSRKGERDVVSEADFIAQSAATMAIRRHFPKDPVLSEENSAGAAVRSSGRVWVVDPLDGTANCLAGLALWSFFVAAVVDGEPVAGAVYAPVLGEMFTAVAGGPALLNGRPIAPSEVADLRDAVVSVTLAPHFDAQAKRRALNWAEALAGKVRGVRILVSGALEVCYVACGRLDGHACASADMFSVAAASLVAARAGCVVLCGGSASYRLSSGREIVVSANAKIHGELSGALRHY